MEVGRKVRAFTLVLVVAIASRASAQPCCTLSADSIEFGTISAEQNNQCTLRITNGGDETLTVFSAKASCPCLKPEIAEKEVPPGKKTELTVRLDLEKYPKNEVSGYVILETNESEGIRQIRVTAKIQPELVVEPDVIDFGTLKRGLLHRMKAKVLQHTQAELAISDVEVPADIECSITKLNSAREEPPKAVYELEITLAPSLLADSLNEKIALNTNIERVPQWTVPVRAQFMGIECTITPSLVTFGPSLPGAELGGVEVKGTADLEVTEAECTVEGVSVAIDKNAAGTCAITLTAAPNAKAGTRAGRIKLHLKENHLQETREISLYGTIASSE